MTYVGTVWRRSWLLLVAACSSSSAPGGAVDGGTPVPDAPVVIPDAPVAIPDAPVVMADAPPAGVDAPLVVVDAPPPDAGSPFTSEMDIPVGGVPYVIAQNASTHRLYVALVTPPGQDFAGAGIAVIDETTDSVVTTIPAPKATNNSPIALTALAVDEVNNQIYAVSSYVPSIFVIDGASNTLTATPIQLGSALPAAVAIDPAAHRLYVWLVVNTSQNITVYDSTNDNFVTSIPLAGIAAGSQKLALDTTNHLLFACGFGATADVGAAVSAIDTTTNTLRGDQVTFASATDGYFVDCQGGPGYASLLTNGTSSSPAVLEMLEPVRITVPNGFTPDSYDTEPYDPDPTILVTIIFGRVADGSTEELGIRTRGETLVGAPYLTGPADPAHPYARWVSFVLTNNPNGKVYVSELLPGDGGPDTPKLAITVFYD